VATGSGRKASRLEDRIVGTCGILYALFMSVLPHSLIAARMLRRFHQAYRPRVRCVGHLAVVLLCAVGSVAAQAPPLTIDTSVVGPRVGDTVPGFSGTDQFGRSHTLQSSLGAKGAMLVFFRSADW
jgi:hypothetical protein